MRKFINKLLMAVSAVAILSSTWPVAARLPKIVQNILLMENGQSSDKLNNSSFEMGNSGLLMDLVMRSYDDESGEYARGVIVSHFGEMSVEKAGKIPELVGDIIHLKLPQKVQKVAITALGELILELPQQEVSSVLGKYRFEMTKDRAVEMAQLIDPRCDNADLPELLRLRLDCAPLETGEIDDTPPGGNTPGGNTRGGGYNS